MTNTKTPAAATGSSKGGKSHPPSKKNAKSKFGEDIIPRRFGLRYDPPTISKIKIGMLFKRRCV